MIFFWRSWRCFWSLLELKKLKTMGWTAACGWGWRGWSYWASPELPSPSLTMMMFFAALSRGSLIARCLWRSGMPRWSGYEAMEGICCEAASLWLILSRLLRWSIWAILAPTSPRCRVGDASELMNWVSGTCERTCVAAALS